MPKNIVIFSDGTGQEGGKGNNTNVYKLFNMIEDRTDKQVSFYDRGLGTGFRKITGNVGGMGIAENIIECYEFIFNNYKAKDNIYLFGFSRGATTVRSLSGFLHYFGILPKSRPELIKRAYKIYKNSDDEDELKKRADEFVLRHHNQWCNIHFLGVWDTVAALGLPFKKLDIFVNRIPFFNHKYHNLRLSDSVIHARHALAIDDKRLTFHPKIWDPLDDDSPDYQTMKQVWFSGMHTDVGGGYKEQDLSDIPLMWMVAEAMEQGLLLYPKHNENIHPNHEGKMHNSREGFPNTWYRKKTRIWNTETHGNPTVHESVSLRKHNENNEDSPENSPWILNEEDYDFKTEPWPEKLRKGSFFMKGGEGLNK